IALIELIFGRAILLLELAADAVAKVGRELEARVVAVGARYAGCEKKAGGGEQIRRRARGGSRARRLIHGLGLATGASRRSASRRFRSGCGLLASARSPRAGSCSALASSSSRRGAGCSARRARRRSSACRPRSPPRSRATPCDSTRRTA